MESLLMRVVGLWSVVAGLVEVEFMGSDEDGPCLRTRKVPCITATHKRGKIYTCDYPDTLDEAIALVKGLDESFDAEKDSRFDYWRTTYGSEDWGIEDEMGLMDEEERCRM